MPDSFLTQAHLDLREQVREFAALEIAPKVAEMEATGEVERDLARLIAKQGWIGVTIPPGYGGMGLGHLAKTVIIQEISRVSGAMGAMVQASQLGVAKVLHFGTQEQKDTWLPRFANGESLPTIAVTEDGSGGHVLGMQARAKRRGKQWVLTGGKIYVGNSHVGDVHGVVARVDKSGELIAFLVESDREGVSLPQPKKTMGLHGFSFGEVVFDECLIPADNMIGTIGEGLDVAYSSSALYGRANLTAVALGIHQAIVEETVRFVKGRRRYGKTLADLPTIKQKLGGMQSRLMSAEVLAHHAADLLDQGHPCDHKLMNAKLVNVELCLDSARDAMEAHGACALYTDRPVERYLRDAHHIIAPAGTSDIQRLRLAELALGVNQHTQWSERFSHVTTGANPTHAAMAK